MRKKHFEGLAEAIGRTLDTLAEWSEPGTGGKLVSLETVEFALLGELGSFVERQGGNAERWRTGVKLGGRLKRCRDKAVEVYEENDEHR